MITTDELAELKTLTTNPRALALLAKVEAKAAVCKTCVHCEEVRTYRCQEHDAPIPADYVMTGGCPKWDTIPF